MESLYCLTIRYLVKRYNLINFEKLNPIVSSDLITAIKNPYYLKQNIKCRVVYKWGAILSYLVKNHPQSRLIAESKVEKGFTPKCEINIQYIDGFAQIWGDYVYDTTNQKVYRRSENFLRQFKHFINGDFVRKHRKVFKYLVLAFEERAFNEFPDLIKWATENKYMSNPIFIPLNVVSKYVCIIDKQNEQIWEHYHL
ncbi:hypothetical protein PV-S19_0330 [Pacmanvirus S19]|nr:hypothetical protein PV-S19_0330 [Pacmanvirus S19]